MTIRSVGIPFAVVQLISGCVILRTVFMFIRRLLRRIQEITTCSTDYERPVIICFGIYQRNLDAQS